MDCAVQACTVDIHVNYVAASRFQIVYMGEIDTERQKLNCFRFSSALGFVEEVSNDSVLVDHVSASSGLNACGGMVDMRIWVHLHAVLSCVWDVGLNAYWLMCCDSTGILGCWRISSVRGRYHMAMEDGAWPAHYASQLPSALQPPKPHQEPNQEGHPKP